MKAASTCAARRPADGLRRLALEPLEDRHLLTAAALLDVGAAADVVDGSPWQNPGYPLDVNNDGSTTPIDVAAIVGRILAGGTGDLPPPDPDPPEFYYDTNGDNRLTPIDLVSVVNAILAAPGVELTATPYTADLTPVVTVAATGFDLPDGLPVAIDVDLNNNGNFSDPGEMGHTATTLANHVSTFEIALDASGEPYEVRLRARVKNTRGVSGTSATVSLRIDRTVSPALGDYTGQVDPLYESHLADDAGITNPIPGATAFGSYRYYILDMTSQSWRADDVDVPAWHHWIEVYVPITPAGQVVADLDDTAVLLVSAGNNTTGAPQSPNETLARAATGLHTIVANLSIVPNAPLIFTGENSSRSGDALLAYTFDQFLAGVGQQDNETWPALVPMVASARRAMDSIQEFVPTLKPDAQINDFLVTGYSDQAWTTWLAAAVDDRVSGIIPGVFEHLNLPAQMAHQYGVYGFFSSALDAYDDLNVFQRILTPAGAELARIVDPYQYFDTGRFDNMPKLLINTPGDEYFATDAAQYYFHDIPGQSNYLRYIPNTPHSLQFVGQEVADSTYSFLDAVLHDRPLPQFTWTVDADETIHVQTVTEPSRVRLWQMNNVNARDFRRTRYPQIYWFSHDLVDEGGGNYSSDVDLPASGARAYYIELTFPNPQPGLPDFVFTTEVRVKSTLPLYPWDFARAAPGDFDALARSLAPFADFTGGVARALAIGNLAEEQPRGAAPISQPQAPVESSRAEQQPAPLMLEPEAIELEIADLEDELVLEVASLASRE